ncbi:MAG: ABC transporter permease, partial [Oleibacter sp.]|nr:ABC transporter permease [Thalassolituus sp.]
MPKSIETVLITVLALCFSAVLVALFMWAAGESPAEVFYTIYRGAFGSWFSWQNTLVRAAPLLLTALCTALPARAGLIVIGGEGAMVVGGLFAALAGLQLVGAPSYVVIGGMLLAGGLSGGLWIASVGAL